MNYISKIIIQSCWLIIFIACACTGEEIGRNKYKNTENKVSRNDTNNSYTISISDCRKKKTRRKTSASLFIVFHDDFKNDTAKVYVNNKLASVDLITTDHQTEVADIIQFKRIDTIKSISIAINSGPRGFLVIDSTKYVIDIGFNPVKRILEICTNNQVVLTD